MPFWTILIFVRFGFGMELDHFGAGACQAPIVSPMSTWLKQKPILTLNINTTIQVLCSTGTRTGGSSSGSGARTCARALGAVFFF